MSKYLIGSIIGGTILFSIGIFLIFLSGFNLFLLANASYLFLFVIGIVLTGLGSIYFLISFDSNKRSKIIERELEKTIRTRTKPAFMKKKRRTALIKLAITSLITATMGITLVFIQVLFDELGLPFYLLLILTIVVLWTNDLTNFVLGETIQEHAEQQKLQEKRELLMKCKEQERKK